MLLEEAFAFCPVSRALEKNQSVTSPCLSCFFPLPLVSPRVSFPSDSFVHPICQTLTCVSSHPVIDKLLSPIFCAFWSYSLQSSLPFWNPELKKMGRQTVPYTL